MRLPSRDGQGSKNPVCIQVTRPRWPVYLVPVDEVAYVLPPQTQPTGQHKWITASCSFSCSSPSFRRVRRRTDHQADLRSGLP